jgi:C_GCAxxG_C_C family probable redox protein
MDHIDIATEAFGNGYNCAQAVLLGYCQGLGLDADNAIKVSSGFGGGMRMSGTCGALTGAFMAVGLKHSGTDPKDAQNKKHTIEKIKMMTKMFKDAHGSTDCSDLLGCDVGTTPEQKQALIKKTCPGLVASAATILEQIL